MQATKEVLVGFCKSSKEFHPEEANAIRGLFEVSSITLRSKSIEYQIQRAKLELLRLENLSVNLKSTKNARN